METQRILMWSLAVVFIASVIWTITASAHADEKVRTCCTAVSTVEFTDPVISVRMQKKSLSCVMAVIFETEQGEFCYDPRQPWVQKKAIQFMRAQIYKRPSSTPSPESSISEHTRVEGSTQSFMNHKHKISTDAPQEERFTSTCCTVVSTVKFTDPIIGFRKQEESLPCVKAIIFETEQGEFCSDPRKRWVQKKVKLFVINQRQIYKGHAHDVPVNRLRSRPLSGKRLSGRFGFQREWHEIHTKRIQYGKELWD